MSPADSTTSYPEPDRRPDEAATGPEWAPLEGEDGRRPLDRSPEPLAPIDPADPELPDDEDNATPDGQDRGAVEQAEPATVDPPDPDHRVAVVALVDRETSEVREHPVLARDCDAAGVAPDSVHAMVDRERPLGFESAEQFQLFRDHLDDSLRAAGLGDAEVVLKGSAGTFWSENPTKTFPASVADARSLAERNGLSPEVAEQRYRDAGYAAPDVARPEKLGWDIAANLGLAPDRSDYDLQIGSDQLHDKVRQYQERNDLADDRVVSPKGGHMREGVVLEAVSSASGESPLLEFKNRWEGQLGREVNVAGFRGTGPPADHPSARRQDDWVVRVREETT